MNEIPIYQIPDQLNCSGPAPSNSYIPNPKHTPAPQGSRNAPFNGNIPEQKQNPDDVQRTEPDFSRMFYLVRHGNENSNSTTKISSMPVRYSAVPGQRGSISTQSSTSEEVTQSVSNSFNINVDNRIVVRSKSLRESNA
ncbi:uncharacterized protein LOC127719107 isoform X1 [Mytilus californianus]|uniref:uncharacterized protein LOC127719107 isoform X1 n=1 Tax=Mytilus californianus TaxID=6549 RepID=UPI002247BA9C|nr:uncharacterized protein LOC127719107 isoform X1 [Mytilus californianus]